MSRSILTTKFFRHDISEFCKKFKENYKKENNEPFKGNVIQYITDGVISRTNGMPESENCYLLIYLGNGIMDNENKETIADEKIKAWEEIEGNKERGTLGLFCDLCKDLVLDLPICAEHTKLINSLEEQVINMQKARNQMTEMLSKFKDMLSNTSEKKEELGVEEKDTQE